MANLFVQLALSGLLVACIIVNLAYDKSLFDVTLKLLGASASGGCNLIDCTDDDANAAFELCDGRKDGRKAALAMSCIVLAVEVMLLGLRLVFRSRSACAQTAAIGYAFNAVLLLVVVGLTVALVKADFPEQKIAGHDVCKSVQDAIKITVGDIVDVTVSVGTAPYLSGAAFILSVVSAVLARRGGSRAGYSDI